MLLFTGVFLPLLWCVWSSPSIHCSRSQLDRKKGVLERDLDLKPATVGFSIVLLEFLVFVTLFWHHLSRACYGPWPILINRFNLKIVSWNSAHVEYCTRKSISVTSFVQCRQNVTLRISHCVILFYLKEQVQYVNLFPRNK